MRSVEKIRPVGRIAKTCTGHVPIKLEDLEFRPAQMLEKKKIISSIALS